MKFTGRSCTHVNHSRQMRAEACAVTVNDQENQVHQHIAQSLLGMNPLDKNSSSRKNKMKERELPSTASTNSTSWRQSRIVE